MLFNILLLRFFNGLFGQSSARWHNIFQRCPVDLLSRHIISSFVPAEPFFIGLLYITVISDLYASILKAPGLANADVFILGNIAFKGVLLLIGQFMEGYLDPKFVVVGIPMEEEILLNRFRRSGQGKFQGGNNVGLAMIVRSDQSHERHAFESQVPNTPEIMYFQILDPHFCTSKQYAAASTIALSMTP